MIKSEPKYIHYAGLYLQKGQNKNMCRGENYSLTGEGRGTYLYIAPVFDSGEDENTWQFLEIKGDFKDCKLEAVVAASDRDYRSVFEDETLSIEEQAEFIRNLSGIRRVNAKNLLLTGLTGRYLYILFQIDGQGECRFTLQEASVEFPKNTFLEYFPEVYQTDNEFFERYTSIFQSMYLQLEKKIDEIPMRLDYEKAELEDLIELAGWIGFDRVILKEAVGDGKPERLRRLIAHVNEIQAGKGTKKALELVLEILYQENIRLLEYFKWYEYLEKRPGELALYQTLYGKDSRCLTVIIENKKLHSYTEAEKKNIYQVINCMLPVGMNCKLLFLRQSCHMDSHCYLDHNSMLASLAAASVGSMELYGNLVLQ